MRVLVGRVTVLQPVPAAGSGLATTTATLAAVEEVLEHDAVAQRQSKRLAELLAERFAVGVTDRLAVCGVTVSRLAHGVPLGGELDYLDEGTLTAALRSRTTL